MTHHVLFYRLDAFHHPHPEQLTLSHGFLLILQKKKKNCLKKEMFKPDWIMKRTINFIQASVLRLCHLLCSQNVPHVPFLIKFAICCSGAFSCGNRCKIVLTNHPLWFDVSWNTKYFYTVKPSSSFCQLLSDFFFIFVTVKFHLSWRTNAGIVQILKKD